MPARADATSPWRSVLAPSWSLGRGADPLPTFVWPVASAVLLAAAWSLAAGRFDVTVFPSPLAVAREAMRMAADGTIWEHAGISAARLAAGFAIGGAVAVPVGLAMGLSPFFRRMMEPFTEFFRFIPAIAMVVFALIWFGIGEASKLFLIAYNAFFSIAMATEMGVARVERSRINAVLSLGGSRRDTALLVVLPSVVPYILQGMRIGMGRAFATIVSAEILAANAGLGYLIYSAREFSRMDTVVVAIVALGLLGLAADRAFVAIARRLYRHTLPEEFGP
ncbi:MAG: ABC transporter permease [Alphaproteobacteria bacterium]|nr:ABC transporter permease [Alphaproteobacteria bacterium]